MAYSRYTNFPLIDEVRQATFKIPIGAAGYSNLDLYENVQTFEYTVKDGDRLDSLAAQFLGRDDLWPLIAIINKIKYPLGNSELYAGRKLFIPTNPDDVRDMLI